MSKNQILYEKVIKNNMPGYENVDPEDLNMERLVEKAIAEVGDLKWVGPKNLPYDYEDDKSDAKTSSIKIPNTIKGTITSTDSKEGALRCTVSNPFSPNQVDFFFIPIDNVKKLETPVGGKKNAAKHAKKIDYSYNRDENKYSHIEEFRCESFEEMCNMK